MERYGRPEDDFRQKLTRADIERICRSHGIDAPREIIAEPRGNEMVAYHLDGTYFLSFGLSDCTKRKVEVLSIFQHLDRMPTPRVIAWSERDADLGVPYMILERIPGSRVDVLWDECSFQGRLQLLDALGRGMGRYHTITPANAAEAARAAGHTRWFIDQTEQRSTGVDTAREKAKACLQDLDARLGRWGIDAASVVPLLKDHYASDPPARNTPFVGAGVIHTEPHPEHFMMEKAKDGFRLSGCVDLEECAVADSFDEIVSMYASMLALDEKFLSAFRQGYEQFFPFPPDARSRLHAGAVDSDLGSVLWLLDTMEKRKEWAFATGWLAGNLKRLEGWLDDSKRISTALFRKDIGPW
jgi:aminoglycoside phosphotransferase (APT) family kinase protein